MFRLFFQVSKIIFLLIFPFIVLIRGSVFLHDNFDLAPWICIFGGIIMTAVLMLIYFSFIQGRISEKKQSIRAIKKRGLFSFILVLGYCVYGILFFSSKNLSQPGLKEEISGVHPIIRLGVSTLVHLDKDLVITGAARIPEDYQKMGLKTKKRSLHYKQSNGYSHALDLRTNNRGEVRNKLVLWYFKLLGFNTLRHVGTSDHLHISIGSLDSPGGI